jgi:CubicO group peptidase (beta-lactamase class C family)
MRFFIVQLILVLILFFFEIGSIFSDRDEPEEIYFDRNTSTSLNMWLSNDLSDFRESSLLDSQISNFVRKWGIKGASVAVTKDGRLVYAKGYGYADVEAGKAMEPGNVFRIASLSKLVTAVAIMQLAEQGKLDLDDKVFGPRGILNQPEYLVYKDPAVERITVRHLLTHKSGWSRKAGDVMFMPHVVAKSMKVSLPVDNETIIRYALSKKLNYRPGTRYSYSNLGYSILGEVIKRVSGIEYADYVELYVFQPLGIADIHMGHSFMDETAFNEVKYYIPSGSRQVLAYNSNDKYVNRVYGGTDIRTLGAAGGWIASPAEFLKLVTAIDGLKTRPDILTEESVRQMTNNGKKGGEMFGWKGSDGYGTWWRTGTLSGSSALLVRQPGGICWMVVFNTTTPKHSRIHREASKMMFQVINAVHEWPDYDLFNPPTGGFTDQSLPWGSYQVIYPQPEQAASGFLTGAEFE